jgi:flagellar biosynthesis protein FlhB
MAGARIHPPSEQRVADARRAGLAPRPALAGFAAAWFALAAGLQLRGPVLWQQVEDLWRRPLEALALRDAGRARALAFSLLADIAGHCALLLAAAAACATLVAWLAQGPHFGLPVRARRPFQQPARSPLAGALAGLAACAVFAALLSPALWLEPAGVALVLTRFAAYMAVVLALAAVVDVALARTAFLRALWMTRQELQDEQREAYGSPELRRARANIRREEVRVAERQDASGSLVRESGAVPRSAGSQPGALEAGARAGQRSATEGPP